MLEPIYQTNENVMHYIVPHLRKKDTTAWNKTYYNGYEADLFRIPTGLLEQIILVWSQTDCVDDESISAWNENLENSKMLYADLTNKKKLRKAKSLSQLLSKRTDISSFYSKKAIRLRLKSPTQY